MKKTILSLLAIVTAMFHYSSAYAQCNIDVNAIICYNTDCGGMVNLSIASSLPPSCAYVELARYTMPVGHTAIATTNPSNSQIPRLTTISTNTWSLCNFTDDGSPLLLRFLSAQGLPICVSNSFLVNEASNTPVTLILRKDATSSLPTQAMHTVSFCHNDGIFADFRLNMPASYNKAASITLTPYDNNGVLLTAQAQTIPPNLYPTTPPFNLKSLFPAVFACPQQTGINIVRNGKRYQIKVTILDCTFAPLVITQDFVVQQCVAQSTMSKKTNTGG